MDVENKRCKQECPNLPSLQLTQLGKFIQLYPGTMGSAVSEALVLKEGSLSLIVIDETRVSLN